MLKICIVLYVLSCFTGICSTESIQCGKHRKASNRFPWHVIIHSDDSASDSPDCGGTILNELYVITAAHCLFDLSGSVIEHTQMRVLIHRKNVVEKTPITKVFHPTEFIVDSFEADVALLKLKFPIDFDEYVGPVCFMQNSQSITTEVSTMPNVREGTNENDIVQWNVADQTLCHGSNRYIFGLTFNHTICMGNLLSSDKFQINRGSGIVVKRNGSWHLVGVLLYTTGPAEDISTYGGGIEVYPFAQWVEAIMTRQLKYTISDTKCQQYNKIAKAPKSVHFAPTISFKGSTGFGAEDVCYGTLISERFILTAAVCNNASGGIFIKNDVLDGKYYKDFKFHFHPEDEHRQGIALVELYKDARDMEYFIHCLWTDEDDTLQFTTELAHGSKIFGTAKIAVTYVPQQTISMSFVDNCPRHTKPSFFKPGDTLATQMQGEQVKRVVGLMSQQIRDCLPPHPVNIINYVPWIVEVVWGG